MTNRDSIRIGASVASYGRAYIIAEAGVNHNGDLATAHRLVDAAAASGADAVKFQTWVTSLICAPGARTAEYQRRSGTDDQYTLLKRLELPFQWHYELREHAHASGIEFLSTPDDAVSARFLAALGVPAIKVGSAEVLNAPHLRLIGGLRLPVILSTGMASLSDVRRGVSELVAAGAPAVAVLHCVSAYPAPEADMNLASLRTLRTELNVPVGLSDHTEGTLAACVATGVGMAIFEKHITLDRSLIGPDHRASADPTEFAATCALLRRAEAMLGSGQKGLAESERDTQRATRRVLVYTRTMAAGVVTSESDFNARRTGGDGLGVELTDSLVGRSLRHAVAAEATVRLADFDA